MSANLAFCGYNCTGPLSRSEKWTEKPQGSNVAFPLCPGYAGPHQSQAGQVKVCRPAYPALCSLRQSFLHPGRLPLRQSLQLGSCRSRHPQQSDRLPMHRSRTSHPTSSLPLPRQGNPACSQARLFVCQGRQYFGSTPPTRPLHTHVRPPIHMCRPTHWRHSTPPHCQPIAPEAPLPHLQLLRSSRLPSADPPGNS